MAKAVVRKATKKPVVKKADKPEYKPVWDLYRDGLTQGSISRFLDCREQFRLGTVFGWKPKAKSGATAFGSAFHDILAATQHSESGDILSLDMAVKHYYEKTYRDLTGSQLEEVRTLLALVKAYIERYKKRWEKEDNSLKWIEREKTFQHTFECLSAKGGETVYDVPLRGRKDGVCRKKDGLWLHETKTKGRIDEEGIASSLPHDVQTMLYCWAIQREYGETPRGVIYDVIRTTSLKPLKGRGKNAVPENSSDYVKRVAADIDVNLNWYFMRWQCVISKEDLDRWVNRFLIPVLGQIVQWWESIKEDPWHPWKSPYHFMRSGAFWSVYGRSDLFHALTKNQFFDLERSEVVYPELVD